MRMWIRSHKLFKSILGYWTYIFKGTFQEISVYFFPLKDFVLFCLFCFIWEQDSLNLQRIKLWRWLFFCVLFCFVLFSFSTLNTSPHSTSPHSVLAWKISTEKSSGDHMNISFYVRIFFLFLLLKILSLSLLLDSFITMYLSENCLGLKFWLINFMNLNI